ncbi:DUF3037 domain-containing protein [Pararcticibacter amylolyticus]|uniref:DUF3037 domain-containing protein n=1 Tax=Pararcticibacter amylolyticus TaxID=2173175 RepID=A0A2U2PLA7_9SPHI|nr:DUF3037 domain-containing protein [Pararcticibacter amylolyticus]PWG82193.1 DUF3037 domain-containing protein [Pararcticibacter amylolyticus]
MQENYLFEYAVIRIVPRVEREEFINSGVILFCARKKFLKCLCVVNEKRLEVFTNDTDFKELREHLKSFADICSGSKAAGPIASLDIASRFRWLTATRSTVIQSSKVHPGFCEDPDETLQKLFSQMVE